MSALNVTASACMYVSLSHSIAQQKHHRIIRDDTENNHGLRMYQIPSYLLFILTNTESEERLYCLVKAEPLSALMMHRIPSHFIFNQLLLFTSCKIVFTFCCAILRKTHLHYLLSQITSIILFEVINFIFKIEFHGYSAA